MKKKPSSVKQIQSTIEKNQNINNTKQLKNKEVMTRENDFNENLETKPEKITEGQEKIKKRQKSNYLKRFQSRQGGSDVCFD